MITLALVGRRGRLAYFLRLRWFVKGRSTGLKKTRQNKTRKYKTRQNKRRKDRNNKNKKRQTLHRAKPSAKTRAKRREDKTKINKGCGIKKKKA